MGVFKSSILFGAFSLAVMGWSTIASAQSVKTDKDKKDKSDTSKPFFSKKWVCKGATRRFEVPAPASPEKNLKNIQDTIDKASEALLKGDAAIANVVFPPNKTYVLAHKANRYDAIHIKGDMNRGLGCLRMNGQNARIVVNNSNTALYVGQCTSCSVRGFTFETIDQTSVTGIIQNVNVKEKTFNLKLYKAFKPFHIKMDREGRNQDIIIGKTNLSAMFFQHRRGAVREHLSHNREGFGHSEIAEVRVYNKAENIIQVRLSSDRALPALKRGDLASLRAPTLNPGKIAKLNELMNGKFREVQIENPYLEDGYFVGEEGGAIYVEQTNGLLLKDITLTDFPSMGVYLAQNIGQVKIDHLEFAKRSPNSLSANGSDGFHTWNDRIGAEIKNSLFQYITDDAINYASVPSVATFISENRRSAILTATARGTLIFKGDMFAIRENQTGRLLGSARVTSAKRLKTKARSYELTFDRPLPAGIKVFGKNEAPDSTRFINVHSANVNFHVHHNRFRSIVRNGVIARSTGVIEKNAFSNLLESAVNIANNDIPEQSGNTGVYGSGGRIHILNNISDDNGAGFLQVKAAPATMVMKMDAVIVKNNHLYRTWDREVRGNMARNFVASGNVIHTEDGFSMKDVVEGPLSQGGFRVDRMNEKNMMPKIREALGPLMAPSTFESIFKIGY